MYAGLLYRFVSTSPRVHIIQSPATVRPLKGAEKSPPADKAQHRDRRQRHEHKQKNQHLPFKPSPWRPPPPQQQQYEQRQRGTRVGNGHDDDEEEDDDDDEEKDRGGPKERVTKLLLILKWGGELTKLGENQARELGNSFRSILYPDVGCGGLLRLHR